MSHAIIAEQVFPSLAQKSVELLQAVTWALILLHSVTYGQKQRWSHGESF